MLEAYINYCSQLRSSHGCSVSIIDGRELKSIKLE